MPEPADIRRPYTIDMEQMRSDLDSVSVVAVEDLPGVQLVDPAAERMAVMVADAVVAASAAQSVKGATSASVRAAALDAITTEGLT